MMRMKGLEERVKRLEMALFGDEAPLDVSPSPTEGVPMLGISNPAPLDQTITMKHGDKEATFIPKCSHGDYCCGHPDCHNGEYGKCENDTPSQPEPTTHCDKCGGNCVSHFVGCPRLPGVPMLGISNPAQYSDHKPTAEPDGCEVCRDGRNPILEDYTPNDGVPPRYVIFCFRCGTELGGDE